MEVADGIVGERQPESLRRTSEKQSKDTRDFVVGRRARVNNTNGQTPPESQLLLPGRLDVTQQMVPSFLVCPI